ALDLAERLATVRKLRRCGMTIKVGFDDHTQGTAEVKDGRIIVTGAQPEAVKDLIAFYANQLGREVGEDKIDDIKPEEVLKRMTERMTGRAWAVLEHAPTLS